MKEIMHGMRKCGVFMTFLLAFAMLSGMLLHARAAENTGEAYDGEVTGSITVTLPELEGMNNEDVQINLYRVGDLDTSNGYLDFALVTELGDVNVNFNDIATAADNEAFDNLPITDGQPYYVFETTEEGEPITYLTQQGIENGFYCMAGEDLMAGGYDRAPAVSLEDEADGVGNAVISNVYSDGLPDGYYYTGEITISKSVMNNGQMIASDDTFYAGVFAVDAQGNESANPTEVVKLNNNGMVTVEVPLGGTDGTEPITYSVKETDENGVPIDKATFSYTVTGEGTVNLSIDQTTGTTNITHTLGNNEGYYQEDSSTETPGDGNSGNGNSGSDTGSNGSSGSGGGTNSSSSSTKTGDNNPIMLYAGLLVAAVILSGM